MKTPFFSIPQGFLRQLLATLLIGLGCAYPLLLCASLPVSPAFCAVCCAAVTLALSLADCMPRLRSHLEQMDTMLSGNGGIGRKLDFLLQEMNREANTTGSKCSDVKVARIVVDIKAELEKIREQTQNIE